MNDVIVIGCGGVGLGLAVALASRGSRVLGVDTDRARVDLLTSGVTGEDPELAGALQAAMASGGLAFATAPNAGARAWVIAVPTPVGADHRLDERPLLAALETVLVHARPGDLVAVRSTVPVGHTRKLAAPAAGRGLLFAACPDRTLAGAAFGEQLTVPQVAGGLDDAAGAAAARLLGTVGEVTLVKSPEAAETLKLFANCWRDAQFALANEMAMYCEAVGVDFDEVRLAGSMGYARFAPPRPGPVGGPCLTKDVHLLAQSAGAPLFVAARAANERLADHVAAQALEAAGAQPGPARIAVLGLAFKGDPPVTDRRGSFGEGLLARLRGMLPGAAVIGWDPVGAPGEGLAATRGAHVVILANDHPALAEPGLLDRCAPDAVVLDLCGLARTMRPDLRIRRLGRGGPR